jgi:hypothetical protein
MENTKFEIRLRGTDGNVSRKLASAAVRGLAVGAHATDPETFIAASGRNFLGHLTRDVTTDGARLVDHVFGTTSAEPVGIEYPFKVGEYVSAEKARTIEAEGGDLLVLAGGTAISGATAVGTRLTFAAGKLAVAAAGEDYSYVLIGQLTPLEAGGVRILAEARTGTVPA